MNIKPYQFRFYMCICVKSGEGFEKGEVYPAFHASFGLEMIYTDTYTEYGDSKVKHLRETDDGWIDAQLPDSKAVFKYFVLKNERIAGRSRIFPYMDDDALRELIQEVKLLENTEPLEISLDTTEPAIYPKKWNISV